MNDERVNMILLLCWGIDNIWSLVSEHVNNYTIEFHDQDSYSWTCSILSVVIINSPCIIIKGKKRRVQAHRRRRSSSYQCHINKMEIIISATYPYVNLLFLELKSVRECWFHYLFYHWWWSLFLGWFSLLGLGGSGSSFSCWSWLCWLCSWGLGGLSLWCWCFFWGLLLFLLRWGNNFLCLLCLWLLLFLLRSCWCFLFGLGCRSLSFFQILLLRSLLGFIGLILWSCITGWSFSAYLFNWFWGFNNHGCFLLNLFLFSSVSLHITVTFAGFIIKGVFSLSLLSLFLGKDKSLSCNIFPFVITMSSTSNWCGSQVWH